MNAALLIVCVVAAPEAKPLAHALRDGDIVAETWSHVDHSMASLKRQKIFFVHFRNVRGTPEKFEETFHDDGMTDMAACMHAYREIGFDGVCRPDHVPTMDGDSSDRPGYSTIGRLFALGYIRGLQHEVYSTS